MSPEVDIKFEAAEPKMRILFLDDMTERHEQFRKMYDGKDHVVDHAWTADQAVELLDANKYDLVLLDHDLTDGHYGTYDASDGADGRAVARFIAGLPDEQRPHHVHVHSWNPDGAEEMRHILDEAGVSVTKAEFGRFELN